MIPVPECVIFDCDGVLVDSETIGIRVLLDMTARYGVTTPLAEAVEEFGGRRLREVIDVLQTRAHESFPTDLESQYRTRSYEVFQTEVVAVPGIKEVLDSLAVPFCVASSGPVEKIKLNLSNTGLLPYFTGRIFSAYDIHRWKPDPGIFLHAADRMGFAPHQCVVIEDSLAGVAAGVAGGFRVLGYARPHNASALEREGAVVFFSMSELPLLLQYV